MSDGLDEQRERVRARARAIGEGPAGAEIAQIGVRARELCQNVSKGTWSPYGAYTALLQLADRAMALVKPHTPCGGSGCSHCCHQALPISELEADALALFAARPRSEPRVEQLNLDRADEFLAYLEGNKAKYMNVACPFLGDRGNCTAYSARPIACRVHHVLMDTPDTCIIGKGGTRIASYNLNFLTEAGAEIQPNGRFADIREWFPE